jgi:hypothetical protein
MIATSPTPRRHHTDLQPLVTRPDTPVDPTRRKSTQGRWSPPTKPTATLPSPSIIAARAYYLELTSPIGLEENATKRRRSLIEGHQVPRRHSVLPTAGSLASQLENFTFKGARKDLQSVPEEEETERKIKAEDDDVCMEEIKECTPVQQVRKSSLLCGTPHEILRQVPFQYTHDHLRDWGFAYLGTSETADAFVNALSLRRPSLEVNEEFPVRSTTLITIRARVLPKSKERKPFLIQRQFNIDELRSSITKAKVCRDSEGENTLTRLRRSSRIRRSSVWQAREHSKKGNCRTPIAERLTPLGTGALPIRKLLWLPSRLLY